MTKPVQIPKYGSWHKGQGLYYGGDYNPDQWLDVPDIMERDFALMGETHTNTFSLNIFGWAQLEPTEGQYDFAWLDDIIQRMEEAGHRVILATPSAAKPVWLAKKYPESCKVDQRLQRKHFGFRHNFCWSSPMYRQKVQQINRLLAKRYGGSSSLVLWHISNEYGGDTLNGACYCELCQQNFREWLQRRYQTIEQLNRCWWSSFWAHIFSDWSEIEAPHEHNDARHNLHGLVLDWKRFTSDNALNFMHAEIAAIREFSDVPVTTNFMSSFEPLNYSRFARELDMISWDSYPQWHTRGDDIALSHRVAFHCDQMRSFKQQSWLLMESTPSAVQWSAYAKLKRPGMNALSSLQAVAHGADGVLYFQFRKGRGGSEKFHGAVVDHVGHVQTRVGRDVSELGRLLEKLGALRGSMPPNIQAAVICDWPTRWAYENSQGPRNDGKVDYIQEAVIEAAGGVLHSQCGGIDYVDECMRFYQSLRKQQIAADVIGSVHDFAKYQLLLAPLLHVVDAGLAQRLRDFVHEGGTLVTGYWSAVVDEHGLCHLGGWPGLLRDVLGIWAEEIDALNPNESRAAQLHCDELEGRYNASLLWESLHLEGAQSVATFSEELFAGQPAITRHPFGRGAAWYIGAHFEQALLDTLLPKIAGAANVPPCVKETLPEGVFANVRENDNGRFVFYQNFLPKEQNFELSQEHYLLDNGKVGALTLPPFGVAITRNRPWQ